MRAIVKIDDHNSKGKKHSAMQLFEDLGHAFNNHKVSNDLVEFEEPNSFDVILGS
mgnify:CR=1 FL=1